MQVCKPIHVTLTPRCCFWRPELVWTAANAQWQQHIEFGEWRG